MALKPDYYYNRIENIEISLLKQNDIRGILLDVDNTLTADHAENLAPPVAEWLEQAKAAGMALAIISNNSEGRVAPFAEKAKLFYVAGAKKPSRKSLGQARETLGCPERNIAVIGDQIFTDIWFARRIRARLAILVKPISTDVLPFVRFKRRLEKPIVKRLVLRP